MLMIQLVLTMKISVKLPVMVRVDNMGSTFMSGNINVMSHINHVGIRYKYMNEYFEGGMVTIIFVNSDENDSSILTKNLDGELHEKAKENYW